MHACPCDAAGLPLRRVRQVSVLDVCPLQAVVPEIRCVLHCLRDATMTRRELIKELRDIRAHGGDEECDHLRADRALLAFIADPGVTAAWEAIDKWFA